MASWKSIGRLAVATSILFWAATHMGAAQAPRGLSIPGFESPATLVGRPFIQPPGLRRPLWTCTRGDGAACGHSELADWNRYRQVLILPTGYTAEERDRFFADAEVLRTTVSDTASPDVFSAKYRSQLLYVTLWVPGGDLGSSAVLGGRTYLDERRGEMLTFDPQAVSETVDTMRKASIPRLSPVAVVLIFDTLSPARGYSTIPSYTGKPFGIIPIAAGEVTNGELAVHELGHGLASWVDEYVERGLEQFSIKTLDALTPSITWQGNLATLASEVGDLLAVYDLKLSEILADNGADNVASSQFPGTVAPWHSETYETQGALGLGLDVWHDTGPTVMGRDEGFAFAHSAAQERIAATIFGRSRSGRANDRLRNAGPLEWPLEFGSTTHVLLFDGDKNNRWQPTVRYDIQVGWWATEWRTCWSGPLPYPCPASTWKVAQKSVFPTHDTMALQLAESSEFAGVFKDLVCSVGLGYAGGGIDICEATLPGREDQGPPAITFSLPYQVAGVPAPQWFTTYYWHFRTYNGRYTSGWTNWSTFYRSM